MPVEVKELVIRASVEAGHELEGEGEGEGEEEKEKEKEGEGKGQLAGRVPLARPRVDREEIVAAAVREVLKILKAAKER